MGNVLRYKPCPIYLPSDSAVTRMFYNTRSHLEGRPSLDDADYEDFETHVVFNDLFIHADGCSIQAVGPPLVNLSAVLLPVELSIVEAGKPVSEKLPLKIRNFDRVSLFSFSLPHEWRNRSELSIVIKFANGIEAEHTIQRTLLPPVELQFVTLQKDNPIDWILDWLRFLEFSGVERVVLYDNGSDNVEEVLLALSSLPTSLSLVLVDWPFPYGPIRSYYNQFCQATQNNHAYQCFGSAAWVGHFDIDEYLMSEQKSGIAAGSLRKLVQKTSLRVGLLRFDSYWIPRLADQLGSAPPTVRDFTFRMRKARGRAHKYLMRSAAYKMANTHNGKVKLGYWRKSVSLKSWAFLHFKPLTTNWRFYTVRGEAETFDQELHVKDSRVADFFKQQSTS